MPQAQGLFWVARQNDTARAVVFFGHRIAEGALQSGTSSYGLTEDADTYDAMLDLAERIRVAIVIGKA